MSSRWPTPLAHSNITINKTSNLDQGTYTVAGRDMYGFKMTETITAGAARFRDDPNREEKYTPLAATWLNGERWEDGPLPERPAVGNARDDALEAEYGEGKDGADELIDRKSVV
mgnify:CR=1 FL=1